MGLNDDWFTLLRVDVEREEFSDFTGIRIEFSQAVARLGTLIVLACRSIGLPPRDEPRLFLLDLERGLTKRLNGTLPLDEHDFQLVGRGSRLYCLTGHRVWMLDLAASETLARLATVG